MVVMAIMAVLMSLSGGLMQKSINQQTKQVELEQIRQLFKNISYKAYYGGGEITVRLEKNQMIIFNKINVIDAIEENDNESLELQQKTEKSDNIAIEYINFEQLTFVAQDYLISSKGIVSPNKYQVFWLEDIRTFQLQSLFNEITL